MAASHSEQAGVLVLGKTLATLSEAVVALAIVRPLGKADVGILSGLLLVHSTVALVLTAGFPETVHQAGVWQSPIITIPYTFSAVYAPRFVELFSAGKSACRSRPPYCSEASRCLARWWPKFGARIGHFWHIGCGFVCCAEIDTVRWPNSLA